jgi:superkiller protein 3
LEITKYKEVKMFLKKQLQKGFLSLLIMSAFLFNSILPVQAQGDIVTSGRIGGGSSVYVSNSSYNAKKSVSATRRKTTPKRTRKQRQTTRRTVARQSKVVAKKNRVRRNIKTVTPQEYEEFKVERATPQEASLVLAGAGEYYVKKDDYEQAVGFLEQAVELDANNQDAKLALSEVYTMLGDQSLEKADEFAELAAKAVKANNQTDIQKYLTQEKFSRQRAEKNFERAIELDPKNSSAYASLGGYLDSLGTKESEEAAKKNYEKALELDPALTNVKAPLGIIYYQQGDEEKADKFISEALAAGEDTAEIQYFTGVIRYKQEDNRNAREALEKSIRMDDENAEAHYYLGATLNRLGDENKAITEFIRATELDPKFVNAWFDLGVAYYNQKKYTEAIDAFDKAVKLNMNQTEEEKRIYAESFANLAETYRQTEQYSLAITNYRVAADLLNDPELYSTYAFVLAKDEKWSASIRIFEKAVQLKPDAVSYANLGWANYQEAQYHAEYNLPAKQKVNLQKAKDALQKAIAADSNLAAAYLNLGSVLNDLGEHREAVNVLEKAIDMQKKWAFAVNELGIAYQKQGELEKAVKQFEKAIKMDGKFADAYFNLGETEVTRGKIKEANKAHRQLQELDSRLADKLGDMIAKANF